MYTFPLNTPQEVKAVTTFKTHPVRFCLSAIKVPYVIPMMVSYTHRSLVHVRKSKVELVRDDEQQLATLKFSQGATSASVSPDGKQIALLYVVMCL